MRKSKDAILENTSEAKLPLDTSKTAPGVNAKGVSDGKYWAAKLDNDDFVHLWRRNGIAHKIVTKFSGDMFKKGFNLNNAKAQALRIDYHMDSIAKYAWNCAAVSGYALIYKGYSDIKEMSDYMLPAPSNVVPEYFYVIPRSWVSEDKKEDFQVKDNDFYEIYDSAGGSFNIHPSRIIRVKLNPEEKSIYEHSYNSLEVAENALWSVGQALWRNAQGFPVISIENPQNIDQGDGTFKPETQVLAESGIMRDINSETGFLADSRYQFDFKGAEGKALRPNEYWEIVLENIAMSVDIPKDILRGVSAGAVTGSRTNLEDYYSVVHSKQITEVQPMYTDMFDCLGVDVMSDDFDWIPIFEQTAEEQALTLKTNAEAFAILVNTGVFSKEQTFNTLKKENKWIEAESYSPEDYSETLNANPNIPVVIGDLAKDAHLNIGFVKKQYSVPDKQIIDSLASNSVEDSALPESTQRAEKKYLKDMGKQYRATEKSVSNLLEAFNTD